MGLIMPAPPASNVIGEGDGWPMRMNGHKALPRPNR